MLRNVMLSTALLIQSAAWADETATPCGAASFRIAVDQGADWWDRQYSLRAKSEGSSEIEIYHTKGGFFYAACVTDSSGRELLLIETFCEGSACPEDHYGIIDPVSQEFLLNPDHYSQGNAREAAFVLGHEPAYLPQSSDSFCCE